MLKRIITSIVALLIFIPILVFSDTWALPAAMSLGAVLGCFEMLSCVNQKKNWWLIVPMGLCSACFPILVRVAYLMGRNFSEVLTLAVGVFLILTVYIFGVAVFANKTLPVTDSAMAAATCSYTVAAFTSIVYIHDFIPFGKYLYLLVFICAWMTDTFAYFTGRVLGKHKLIPAVSPKKTVEGAIGGVVFCIGGVLLYGFILEKFFVSEGQANYIVLAVSALFMSVISQVGDLIMSVIKRHYGIKDYGKLLPGHGGILDRFDSVMAVSIMLAFICTYFNMLT